MENLKHPNSKNKYSMKKLNNTQRNRLLELKNNILKLKNNFIGLKDRELKDRELKIKNEMEELFLNNLLCLYIWLINYTPEPIRKTVDGFKDKVAHLFKTNCVWLQKETKQIKNKKKSEKDNIIKNIRNHFILRRENQAMQILFQNTLWQSTY